jgi:hypothetical protein
MRLDYLVEVWGGGCGVFLGWEMVYGEIWLAGVFGGGWIEA